MRESLLSLLSLGGATTEQYTFPMSSADTNGKYKEWVCAVTKVLHNPRNNWNAD